MKQSPELHQIQDNMRTGPLAAYRFLGDDPRNLAEIIGEDQQIVAKAGLTTTLIAERMKYLTKHGEENLGTPVVVDDTFRVIVEEHKGVIPCPFRDHYNAAKRDVTVVNLQLMESVQWSDLSVHLIEEHGFFEGVGASYRLDPEKLTKVIGL